MRTGTWLAGCTATIIGGIYLLNASWLAPAPQRPPELLAHRGIHQTFPPEGIQSDTCTATRIKPPTNPYLENTLSSMKATFAVGANVIELDVHPTTDGEFAVFHDWSLDCRTDGHGVTRKQAMSYLRTLDIGYGYTADEGRTFPFRGKGVGMMPTLHEVLSAFPGRQFLINIKSRDPTEGQRLVTYLRAHGDPVDRRLLVYGHARPLGEIKRLAPAARLWSGRTAKECVLRYLALGWSGYVPEACIGRAIGVPLNLKWAYWGWPNRFQERMRRSNVDVMITGPVRRGDPGARGIDSLTEFADIPQNFGGTIITNEIALIGPSARARWAGIAPAAATGMR